MGQVHLKTPGMIQLKIEYGLCEGDPELCQRLFVRSQIKATSSQVFVTLSSIQKLSQKPTIALPETISLILGG